MNTSSLLLGFILIWLAFYWVFPSMLVRLREPRRAEVREHGRFLSETGTVHRLGRRESSENA
jgi:hypothetical protein